MRVFRQFQREVRRMVLLRGSVGMWSGRWGSTFGSPTEGRVGPTDHANRSSTVGSSPGVAKKRMLGVFSFRTSDGTMSSSIAFGGRHRWCHLGNPALPIQSRMEHLMHSCETGAIRLPASSCAATRSGSGTRRAGPQKPSSGMSLDGFRDRIPSPLQRDVAQHH